MAFDRRNPLKDLLDPNDPLTSQVIFDAYDPLDDPQAQFIPKINNLGEILVTGALVPAKPRDTPNRAYLLVPVSR